MRWESPWLLLLLLAVPALAWLARRGDARRAAVLWVRSRPWGTGARARLVRATGVLPWLALALALLAMARPQQGLRLSETETRGVDIVLGIDISPSMSAQDFLPRNRLNVAKETARDFVRQRPHDRIGLVGFAATAFTQCPLTLDHDALTELLQGLDFGLAEDGTAIGMGLATAVARLRESRTPSKVIVLLTDGQNNRGQIDPLTGADLARAFGIKVYTILVGRGGMVPVPQDDPVAGRRIVMMRMDVDEGTLRQIASRTGGRFFRATDAAALAEIYGAIDRLERAPIRAVAYNEYHDLGPLLLGLAALLLAAWALGSTTFAFRLP
ncbi:MAG: VWA domain-containing protein [Candidatus Eisenbacteria bacterium]|nr:VWA domain-containing protein [Candidatus Eisenbacteria bacterium]